MNRLLKRLLQIAAVVVVVAGIAGYRDLRAQAQLGTGYVAHQMCSCIFVAERSYESCRPDMLPMMDRIESEVIRHEGQDGVRTWISIFAERRAVHTPGRGCAID